MAPTSIRKAIGAVKDQTSIGIAKVAGNVAPELEVLVVKATSHDNEPAEEKYVQDLLRLTSYTIAYVKAFVFAISRRLSKTHDWIVALKSLMLVHRLLVDGDSNLGQEIMYASRKGARILNMSDFRDEAHSNSWDHSGFVKTYALYLDQKLEYMLYERKLRAWGQPRNDEDDDDYRNGVYRDDHSYRMKGSSSYGDVSESERNGRTPVREMKPERALERLNQLLGLLERFLACRPTGAAKNSRMVIVALYPILKESFKLYADIREVLGVLLDRFPEMEYADCVKVFDAYSNAAKMVDELSGVYLWCKDTGVARSSEYPEVQKITDKLLGTLEGFLRERAHKPKSPEKLSSTVMNEEEPVHDDMNEVKALPPPENENSTPTPPPPEPQPKPQPQHVTEELINLRDTTSAEDHSNNLALALFSGAAITNSWEAFPSSGESEVTSAWQTPAAESGKADWELALVESASNLSKQKADMGGGLYPLLLNGMYDQGTVRQHLSNSEISGGSASSLVLPGAGKSANPVLALPAPDGTVQAVGHKDPFAASLYVLPPSYVQIADMEKKQHLLVQEQQIWQQYESNGMQGQVGLSNISSGGVGYYGQHGSYYNAPY